MTSKVLLELELEPVPGHASSDSSCWVWFNHVCLGQPKIRFFNRTLLGDLTMGLQSRARSFFLIWLASLVAKPIPTLPPGLSVHTDPVSSGVVLDNSNPSWPYYSLVMQRRRPQLRCDESTSGSLLKIPKGFWTYSKTWGLEFVVFLATLALGGLRAIGA
ncbi:hypothetical protein MRB53_010135 [Persea americana]|uniref:Uncharacterized protein n=1 Tax=Persea americana TaxID=3435 RepID=A0ACC2LRQ6_PERAE|nr:hypothetical protein MRB53_010135 [Persea americana]